MNSAVSVMTTDAYATTSPILRVDGALLDQPHVADEHLRREQIRRRSITRPYGSTMPLMPVLADRAR